MDDPRELQAQAVTRGLIERIEAAGTEDRAETIRRIREIRDPQVRARVLELMVEFHQRRSSE